MATGLPSGQLVEVEFTAGVWTDVSADVEFAAGLPIRVGRTSPQSQAQIATFTCQLANQLGKYTPGRQVLTDGTTVHPYWPNILPRKRIRYSYLDGGSVRRYRFTGYIKSWPPALQNGVRPFVVINATDRMDQLSRVPLQSPIRQEITLDTPALWWPLADAATSIAALEQSGNGGPPLGTAGTGAALVFGDNGPGFGDGPGVKMAAGQYLAASTGVSAGIAARTFTLEFWFNIAAAPGAAAALVTLDGDVAFATQLGPITVGLNTARNVTVTHEAGTITSSTVAAVNSWHHVALTRNFASSGYVLYVDGVNVGSATGNSIIGHWGQITVGQATGFALYSGNVGQVAVYNTVLSTTRIASHATAGVGYYGDTTGARIARYLAYAGLTGSDWTLDTGVAVVNTYPQSGKSVLQACQDMATTEGGGAALFVDGTGTVRFVDRRFRKPGAPVMTIDAVQDLDGSVYSPAFDDSTLINTESVDRAAESGVLSTQTYTDLTSQGIYGVLADQATTYTVSDVDAANLAQFDVHSQSTPAFRLPQVATDLMHAENNLYAQLGVVLIGSRIRVTNLAAKAAPISQLDLHAEGWSETPSTDGYQVVFDASPADNPPKWVWDTSRWQCDGQTLSTALTLPTTTTVVIATAAGKPTFTINAGMYPLKIRIGEERIQLNTPPGGATSPQTFTGVTRHVDNTLAAAQAAGQVIQLAPADTWALG